jgi:hypothetical protein
VCQPPRMSKIIISKYVAGVFVALSSAKAFADPMVPSGGGVVIVPSAGRDWLMWGLSALVGAAVPLMLFFLEHKKRLDAKKPAFDLHLTSTDKNDYSFRMVVRNKDDVSIRLRYLSVPSPLTLGLRQHHAIFRRREGTARGCRNRSLRWGPWGSCRPPVFPSREDAVA